MGEANPFEGGPFPPRVWHREAYPECMRWLRSKKRGLLYACTGAGKSYLVCAISREITKTMRPGYCVVIEVPTQALVRQMTEKDLPKWLPKASIGTWYGRKRIIKPRPVIVACRDSLPKLVEFLEAHKIKIACLIADEAHRIEAERYREAIDALSPSTMMGVTATPYLASDGLEAWDGLIYQYRITRAVEEGVLVPARLVVGAGDGTDAIDDAITASREAGPYSIVDCYGIDDAEQHARDLTDDGVPALAVHSQMPQKSVDAALEAHKTGKVWALCQVDMLSEGVDMPYLRSLVLRRPIGSHVRRIQLMGRALRCHPGKDHATIYDLLGQLRGYVVDRDAALGRVEEEAAREARSSTPESRREAAWDEVIARVVARDETVRWLVGASQSVGADPIPEHLADEPAPAWLCDSIRESSRRTRWIHRDDRPAVRRLVERPEAMTWAAAQGLLDVLRAASKAAWEQRQTVDAWDQVTVRTRIPGAPKLAVMRLTSRSWPAQEKK